ncbi:hypothetical protein SELMODRAFT_432162 [Selaginella moellendorffii]|uniref:Receptor-like serine/threonine-protein kinase n=1 Tax=Selaginella moellendorffii TaxID=88036 RepID=D8TF62_SELML|nr:hypothetical protein SELMODRAFT_432162 [Selaginella moellendorffii]
MSETTFMKLHTLMLLLSSTYYSRVLADFLRGSTVTTGSPWRSPGGTFGFGFVMPETSSTRNFNLAIWYDIDPKKTVVWMAMANGQLVQVSENAKLELKAKGGLSVTDGSSSVPFWQTNPGQCCAESAALLENGNLVVLQKDKKVAWQSFDSPTNNLLPEQQLRTQGNPSLGYTRLISQSGAYQLVLNSGQVLLKNLKLEVPQKYWSIANPTLNSTMTCLDDETGEHDLEEQEWLLEHRLASRHARVRRPGTCGPFALCTYRPTKTCSCPPGFHRVDPNDESKGCDYDIPLGGCQNSSNSVKLVQVNRADYYFNDYNFDSAIKSLEKCKDTCMQDCKCLAAAYKYDGTGLCFLKGSSNKLYNGKQTLNEINMVFMKLSSLDTSAADDQHDPFLADANATVSDQVMRKINKWTVYLSRHPIILSVAIVELGLFATGAAVVAAVWTKTSRRKWEEMTGEIEGLPTKFTYRQLQDATDNFRNELGSGGFESVYRGNIPEKGGIVAVKKITTVNQAEKQCKAEVSTIGRVHHVNLVRLLGYCAEGDRHLLVYQFMTNGSLDHHLSASSSSAASQEIFSTSETQHSIALGIAKGLTYLLWRAHRPLRYQATKRAAGRPKVADFGLARMMRKESMSVTTVQGTRGYLAPEWLESQSITPKANVYSFGMLLLDILSGKRKALMELGSGDKEYENAPLPPPGECSTSK